MSVIPVGVLICFVVVQLPAHRAAVYDSSAQTVSRRIPFTSISTNPPASQWASPHSLEAPRNLSLLRSGVDPNGQSYLQIGWLPPLQPATTTTTAVAASPTADQRPLEAIDRYRITWREEGQPAPDEYRKTIDGDLTSYTIEHLPINAYIQIEVQAFRWVEDRKLRSAKAMITARTPFRKISSQPDLSQTDLRLSPSLPANATASLPDSNITIESVFYQNGLVKANISWLPADLTQPHSFGYVIRWYPKVCLGWERRIPKERVLIKPLVGMSVTNNHLLYDLDYNCRYAVAIYRKLTESGKTERLTGIKHFMTPVCQDIQVVGNLQPHCPKLASRLPSEPRNLSCIFLVQGAEISATCSWENPGASDQPVIGYRAIFAKKLLDPQGLYGVKPFPILDRNSYLVKVLDEDEMAFSIANLEEETEYIIYVQAVSAAGFGTMAKLDFVSPKIRHSLALSQTSPQRDFTALTQTSVSRRLCSDLLPFSLSVMLLLVVPYSVM
ncbi:anosmin-1-like [Paramacrobiotus metropolitanus]|uniref:anosmin-1-like n=1 Tax=Paramacrobiotus metropolitanus TaxID=2943436 RepID=UPI002445C9A0|nr:anosmin-1-like [Paramacrobiotus metropolitanus]